MLVASTTELLQLLTAKLFKQGNTRVENFMNIGLKGKSYEGHIYNYTLQTNPLHREKEPHNTGCHKTSADRQLK